AQLCVMRESHCLSFLDWKFKQQNMKGLHSLSLSLSLSLSHTHTPHPHTPQHTHTHTHTHTLTHTHTIKLLISAMQLGNIRIVYNLINHKQVLTCVCVCVCVCV